MKRLLFTLLAATSLSACANPPAAGLTAAFDASALAGTTWAYPAGSGGNQPRLQFVSQVSVSGTGGCNTFTGKAEFARSRLLIGPLLTTKRMCIGSPQHVEDAFFRALGAARTGRIDDGQLVLVDGSGQDVIRLSRVSTTASSRP